METTEATTEPTKAMRNELIVFIEQSGIDLAKGNEIAWSLQQFFNKATEWDKIIRGIVITDISETGKMKIARDSRLELRNYRLEAGNNIAERRKIVKYRMANDVLEDKILLKAWQIIEATFKNLETMLQDLNI